MCRSDVSFDQWVFSFTFWFSAPLKRLKAVSSDLAVRPRFQNGSDVFSTPSSTPKPRRHGLPDPPWRVSDRLVSPTMSCRFYSKTLNWPIKHHVMASVMTSHHRLWNCLWWCLSLEMLLLISEARRVLWNRQVVRIWTRPLRFRKNQFVSFMESLRKWSDRLVSCDRFVFQTVGFGF